jgi:hypothetical protein
LAASGPPASPVRRDDLPSFLEFRFYLLHRASSSLFERHLLEIKAFEPTYINGGLILHDPKPARTTAFILKAKQLDPFFRR